MSSDYLDRIADFSAGLRFSDLPTDVVARAEWMLLDGFAVMVAGAGEPRVRQLAASLRQRGSQGRSAFAVEGWRGPVDCRPMAPLRYVAGMQ